MHAIFLIRYFLHISVEVGYNVFQYFSECLNLATHLFQMPLEDLLRAHIIDDLMNLDLLSEFFNIFSNRIISHARVLLSDKCIILFKVINFFFDFVLQESC